MFGGKPKDDFVCTPAVFLSELGDDYKGGPGIYDQSKQDIWDSRTPSPNGVPEKFYELAMPGIQPPPTGVDGEQINREDQTVHVDGRGKTSSGY